MIDRTSFGLSIAFAAALCYPSALQSQVGVNKAFASLTTDSTAWQQVLVYAVAALSSELLASASDPTPQAWQIELPPDEPQEQLIRTQLRTILRVRQAMPADTLVRSLAFGPLNIVNDSARVEVRYRETQKCPGTDRTTGSGWSTTVFVPRDPKHKFWGAARSGATMGGDRRPC